MLRSLPNLWLLAILHQGPAYVIPRRGDCTYGAGVENGKRHGNIEKDANASAPLEDLNVIMARSAPVILLDPTSPMGQLSLECLVRARNYYV